MCCVDFVPFLQVGITFVLKRRRKEKKDEVPYEIMVR